MALYLSSNEKTSYQLIYILPINQVLCNKITVTTDSFLWFCFTLCMVSFMNFIHANIHLYICMYVFKVATLASYYCQYIYIVISSCMVYCYTMYIPYTYKFSRDVIFAVFAVNVSSTKFSSSKFHW